MAVCPGATARAHTTPGLSTTIPVPGGAGPGAPVAPDAPVAPVAPLPVAPVAPVAPLPVAPVAPIAPVAPAPVAPVAPAPVAPVAPAPAGPVAPVEPTRPTGPVAPVAPPPPPPLGQGSGVIPWRVKYDSEASTIEIIDSASCVNVAALSVVTLTEVYRDSHTALQVFSITKTCNVSGGLVSGEISHASSNPLAKVPAMVTNPA